MNSLASNFRGLFIFSFYLRLNDNDDDKYTKMFLDYIKSTNLSPLIRKIIMSNRKNEEGNDLVWSSQSRFKLMCGKDF